MGLPPIPPCPLTSSMASVAPLRMNSPYPPSGPERMHWQPILIGFLSLRSGLAAKPVRGSARPAAASAVDWRKRRRVVPRRGAMGDLRQRGGAMIVPPGPKSQSTRYFGENFGENFGDTIRNPACQLAPGRVARSVSAGEPFVGRLSYLVQPVEPLYVIRPTDAG